MVAEKLLDKLRKMKVMAEREDGNEAEAQAFAAALATLLQKHNLDMSELEWEQEKQATATVGDWSRVDGGNRNNFGKWAVNLASTIADANSCRILVTGLHKIRFIGTEAAVETAKATMDYMYYAARKFARAGQAEYEKQHGKTSNFKGAYLLGFSHRLSQRLREEAAKVQGEYRGSTALIRLSESLRLADAYIANLRGVRSRSFGGRAKNSEAYQAGVNRANQVNVGGPVVGDGAKPGLNKGQNFLK